MTVLKGKVLSGIGNFSYWMEKLEAHYLRKTGVKLFPGTLNVQLEEPYSLPPDPLRLEKEEYGGSVSVSIVPCTFMGHAAYILRTDANEQGRGHHAKNIIEIASVVKLRDAFNLQDGDVVEVEIDS
jgi:riboflavin kinase